MLIEIKSTGNILSEGKFFDSFFYTNFLLKGQLKNLFKFRGYFMKKFSGLVIVFAFLISACGSSSSGGGGSTPDYVGSWSIDT